MRTVWSVMIRLLNPAVLTSSIALGQTAPQPRADRSQRYAGRDRQRWRPIELRAGVAISGINRERRAAVAIDPVAAQIVAGTWAMPKAGDLVTAPQGQSRRWESVKVGPDGWFSGAAIRGGYLALTVNSADDRVMMLEASGHAMVYAANEPRGGDIYETGFMQLPVRLHKGENQFLFQTGRDRLKARLTLPKASAFFNTADTTMPDLIAGETPSGEGAVVIVNAAETWRDDLAIVARFAGKDETRTPVPALVPLSARKIGFRIGGTMPPHMENAPLDLTLHQKTHDGGGDLWRIVDSTTVVLRVRQPAQRTSARSEAQSMAVCSTMRSCRRSRQRPRHRRPLLALCSPSTAQVLKQ